MSPGLDHADLTLLKLLQQNARLGLDELAHACHLSVASVQRRLKKLRDRGIIQREVAVLDPSALGLSMTFLVLVELEREGVEDLHLFREAVVAEPQVQQCYYITGDADFALLCSARDMPDFEALTQRLFFENANVRRFRTSVVMQRTKVSLAVPVRETLSS